MLNKERKLITVLTVATMALATGAFTAGANEMNITSVLPSAGVSYALAPRQVSLSDLMNSEEVKASIGASFDETAHSEIEAVEITDTEPVSGLVSDVVELPAEEEEELTPEEEAREAEDALFSTLVIARVNNYVNVRDIASEEGEIVGKLYDKSVGTYLGEENGWYKIESGKCTGYVKAEFCVTGDEAVELAREVGTRIATVNTTTLKVRMEPSLEAEVLGLVPIEDQLVVTEELDGWVKVEIEEGYGYVSTDYVILSTEFVKAESRAEEEARLAKERAAQEAARKAAQKNTSKSSEKSSGSSKTYNSAETYTTQSSSIGQAVADYAVQFVGNPYVYGGTSLTNGADCSGFVMSVYANFGVSLPHSSAADRHVGAAVDGLANAQPGDLVCYSGHVGLYIGGGQIVHASTSKTGIIISNASYRTPLAVRRIF